MNLLHRHIILQAVVTVLLLLILGQFNIAFASNALLAYGEIKSRQDGSCLDNNHDYTVIQYHCHGGEDQKWYLFANGELRSPRYADRCLDGDNGSVIALSLSGETNSIRMRTCNGSEQQKWFLKSDGRLVNKLTGQCVDGNGSNPITPYTCDGTSDQYWSMIKLPWSKFRVGANEEYCIDVQGNEPNNNSVLQLYQCQNSPQSQKDSQLWILTDRGELRSALAFDMCLDIPGGANYATTGRNLQLFQCNNKIHQRWTLTASNELRSKIDGVDQCVSVEGRQAKNNARLELGPCQGREHQIWNSQAHTRRPSVLEAIGPIKLGMSGNNCMSPVNRELTNHTKLTSSVCDASIEQNWLFTHEGEIRNQANTNLCLDMIEPYTAGAGIQLYTCNGKRDKFWQYTASGQLQSIHYPGLCIVSDLGTGSTFYLDDCNSNNNPQQTWNIATFNWSTISNGANTGLCLNVAGDYTRPLANVQLYNCGNDKNEQWLFTAEEEIRSAVAPDRCLTADSTNNIVVDQCTDNKLQKWFQTATGELKLKSANDTNLCLAIASDGVASKSNVQLRDCVASPAQRWSSAGFAQIELRQIDGYLSLLYNTGNGAYAVTDPKSILQLAHHLYGIDTVVNADTSATCGELHATPDVQPDLVNLSDIHASFNDEQCAALKVYIDDSGLTVEGLAKAGFPALELLHGVEIQGPQAEAHFIYSPDQVGAEVGLDLLSLGHPDYANVTVGGPGATAMLTVSPDSRNVAINGGYTIIDVTATVGNEDGSYLGVGGGVGAGIEGDFRFGTDGQWGATLGLKYVTVKFYIGESDASQAYFATAEQLTNGANFTQDSFTSLANFSIEASQEVYHAASTSVKWFAGTAVDSGQFFKSAGDSVGNWVTAALNDFGSSLNKVLNSVGDVFEDIGDGITSCFGLC